MKTITLNIPEGQRIGEAIVYGIDNSIYQKIDNLEEYKDLLSEIADQELRNLLKKLDGK